MASMLTLTVVRQHLDDAAFADLAVPAAFDHVLEFGFQRGEAAYPLDHFSQPGLDNSVCSGARLAGIVLQGRQRPDGVDLKSQFTSMVDECQPAQILLAIEAPVALGARTSGQQAYLLVNRRNLDVCCARRLR